MLVRDRFKADGERLFRWRSYSPLILLVVVVSQLVWGGRPDFARHLAWDILCFGIALSGQAIRLVVAGAIPAGSSGRNTRYQIADSLNTTGAYSLVRHPLYLGNFLIWVGLTLIAANAQLSVLVILVFWLVHERIMYAEEEFLRAQFGELYRDWAARTPAFVPRWIGYRPARLGFSIRAAIRREYSSAIALVTVFVLFRWVAVYPETAAWPPGEPRLTLLVVASVYVALSAVKRRTDWLDVEGR